LEGAKIGGAHGVSQKVFFTQKMLDSLNDQRKIELNGNILTILTGEKPSFNLEVAYRFIIVDGGGEDTNNLLGKVKTEKELSTIKQRSIWTLPLLEILLTELNRVSSEYRLKARQLKLPSKQLLHRLPLHPQLQWLLQNLLQLKGLLLLYHHLLHCLSRQRKPLLKSPTKSSWPISS
jgi:hypothetical protein